MKIIDISWPIITGMTEYKNRASLKITTVKTVAIDGVQESLLTMHSHTGTHVDAPAHFVPGGATIDTISIAVLCGHCLVIDMTHVGEKITAQDLSQIDLNAGQRVLFKTKNSALSVDAPFDAAFVYLAECAAEYLVQKKVVAVGIDYLGIERNQQNHVTHTLLLQHNIALIEGLRLADVVPGKYMLYCLPLNIVGIDGAPARAIVVEI